MASAGQRATERYRLLVEGLGEEIGKRYGWLSEVARSLGIDVSQLKRILAGKSGVGLDTVEMAVQRVPIRRAYFMHDGVADWRDYVATNPSGDPAIDTSWPASRARAEEFVKSLRDNEPDPALARAMAQLVADDSVVRAALKVLAAKSDRDAVARGNELAALLLADEKPASAPSLPTVRVRAVQDRFIRMGGDPMPIGYRKARRTDDPTAVRAFQGANIIADGEVDVPLTLHIRGCLEDGALERC